MFKRSIILAFALSILSFAAQAEPRDGYQDDNHEAAQRYEDARRVCDNERNHGQKKKCMRELERSHAQARGNAQNVCGDCGKVVGVRVVERAGDSNALGLIGGGAAGALLGNQVGGGNGKTLATLAGALGGAYAGKKLQEHANATQMWAVDVQYDNGRHASFNFERDPGMQRGDRVRNAGSSIGRY